MLSFLIVLLRPGVHQNFVLRSISFIEHNVTSWVKLKVIEYAKSINSTP